MGNALTIQGLKSGSAKVCIPIDKDIPKCTFKYVVTDFALGDNAGQPGMLLETSTTTDKTEQICGLVPLGSSGKVLVFPVIRTRDLLPYTPYVGEVTEARMILDISSKELFTNDKMRAFKSSVSASIAVIGVDADAIVIVSVCDASGCIDFATFRRAISSGITVVYQIQVAGASLAAIKAAITSDSFVSTFVSQMAAQGYTVVATVDKVETVTNEQAAADEGTPAPGDTLSTSQSAGAHKMNPVSRAFVLAFVIALAAKIGCQY